MIFPCDDAATASASRRRPTLALCFSLLLAACANVADKPTDGWRQDMPPVRFFVRAYEADPRLAPLQSRNEYLYWVRSFYEGTTLYPRGWNDLVYEQLSAAAREGPATVEARARRLYRIGRDIAAEWAKDNSLRRVNNRHLSIWGEAAGRAIREGNVEETLAKISSDLNRLLARELPPEKIMPARYHPQDPDDWFAL